MNLECIRTLQGHDGYVVSVAWDPVGKYIASLSSEDKKLIIWRTAGFQKETSVTCAELSKSNNLSVRMRWGTNFFLRN